MAIWDFLYLCLFYWVYELGNVIDVESLFNTLLLK